VSSTGEIRIANVAAKGSGLRGQLDRRAREDAAVDGLILVTSDHHLLDLGPNWNGRLVMRPRDFVRRVIAR
jgi:hypothetical protein